MPWNKIAIAVYCAICMTLLWVISGLSRTHGLTWFAGGLAIWGAVWTISVWRPKTAHYVFLFGLSLAASSVLLLEAALHVKPDLLRGKLADGTYGGYHAGPGGIYRRDRHLGWAMLANYARDMYWSGHWWRHEANCDGYRGHAHKSPEVVFLGDSMIYGHGVENEQTIPSQYERLTNSPTANLGQQATCLVQSWIRLMRQGASWKPKVVFVCSHFNDISDAAIWYPPNEMEKFVTQPLEINTFPVVHEKLWPRRGFRPRHWWNRHVAFHSRAGALVHVMQRSLEHGMRCETNVATNDGSEERFVPAMEMVTKKFTPWERGSANNLQLGWQAHVQALKRIKHYCDERGARLILFDVGYPTAFVQAMEKTASELGVEYAPAGRVVLSRCLAGESVYLANDGHWSPRGCEIIARTLVNEVAQ